MGDFTSASCIINYGKRMVLLVLLNKKHYNLLYLQRHNNVQRIRGFNSALKPLREDASMGILAEFIRQGSIGE